MKKNVKKVAILGGVLTILFLLYKKYNKKGVTLGTSNTKKSKTTKPPKNTTPPIPEEPSSPTPTPPYIPQTPRGGGTSRGGGTGGMVTNNQTVPENYNPRDYGDIVLGNVDRSGNILR